MVAVTSDPNPGADDGQESSQEEATGDAEPSMFARTDDDGRFKIERVKPGNYNVVVWFASGHKGWMRDNSEAAMKRDLGGGKVVRIEEPIYGGANGALKIAHDMPEEYWEKLK